MEIYYKDELIGRIKTDPLQDEFPWVIGKIIPTAIMDKYIEFFEWYSETELDFPYYPFNEEVYEYFQHNDAEYPRKDEERYAKSELYSLTELLKGLHQSFRSGNNDAVSRIIQESGWDLENWLDRWQDYCDDEKFMAYLEFLDYRNWKITDNEREVPWIPYPPTFNIDDMSIAWR